MDEASAVNFGHNVTYPGVIILLLVLEKYFAGTQQ